MTGSRLASQPSWLQDVTHTLSDITRLICIVHVGMKPVQGCIGCCCNYIFIYGCQRFLRFRCLVFLAIGSKLFQISSTCILAEYRH